MPSSMNGSGYDTPDLHKDDLSDEGRAHACCVFGPGVLILRSY